MRLLALAALVACSPALGAPEPGGEAVLRAYCAACHGVKAEGDLGFITDTGRLITEGYLVPGEAARSPLIQRIAAGEMPPDGKPRPTSRELAVLRAWVDGMAAPSTYRDAREVDRLLIADAARSGTQARWFSLVHLANAGATETQLERYRTALVTLLGSLTWAAKAPRVIAIDRERTLFRIELGELGWSAATWDAIRASYPYGMARGRVPEALRADWFVATASRAPLYTQLLGLPETEAELARRLGLDLAEDIRRAEVVRAGFNRSGVSVNNRVIERHATRFGAYWRSYDFASNLGRENVFEHPLDFVPAGGEIIFNLPDGLQAYMLVDRSGKRIDRAPQAIVSDPRRPDRAVDNAVSCMGCHAAGIIPKADQLRDAPLERGVADRVRILHPEAATLGRLYDEDRARFARALAAIGASPGEPADEPITALTTRYEAELDLATAAVELGLRPAELAQRLPRLYGLRQALGGLANPGGTVKRDAWAALFPRVVDALGVGVAYTPGPSNEPPPTVWLDERRRSWVVVDRASDQATAVTLCQRRAYELPREAELVSAVASGLAAGLGLTSPIWAAGTKLDASNLRYAAVVDPVTGLPRRADVTARHVVVCVVR